MIIWSISFFSDSRVKNKQYFYCLFYRSLFKNLYRNRQEIGAHVGHEVGIVHDVYEIFQVAFRKTGQRLIPPAEDQDMEPLDEKADKSEDPVDPEDNADNYPIDDADKSSPGTEEVEIYPVNPP